MVGRLKPGITRDQAEQDAQRVAQEISRNFPPAMGKLRIHGVVQPARRSYNLHREASRPHALFRSYSSPVYRLCQFGRSLARQGHSPQTRNLSAPRAGCKRSRNTAPVPCRSVSLERCRRACRTRPGVGCAPRRRQPSAGNPSACQRHRPRLESCSLRRGLGSFHRPSLRTRSRHYRCAHRRSTMRSKKAAAQVLPAVMRACALHWSLQNWRWLWSCLPPPVF